MCLVCDLVLILLSFALGGWLWFAASGCCVLFYLCWCWGCVCVADRFVVVVECVLLVCACCLLLYLVVIWVVLGCWVVGLVFS